MDESAPNYHREFFPSPHHAALALLTLGLGFLSAQLLGLIVGATAYVLGWIYLPDLPFFRRWVDRRRENAKRAEDAQKVAGFIQRRDELIGSLSPSRRDRYNRLAEVCGDIETAGADNLLASTERSQVYGLQLRPAGGLQIQGRLRRQQQVYPDLFGVTLNGGQASASYQVRELQIEVGWEYFDSWTSFGQVRDRRVYVRVRRDVVFF